MSNIDIFYTASDNVVAAVKTLSMSAEKLCKWLKGNAQILFLYKLPKSGASRVYIALPQITPKILTKDIIHWLEMITEILCFLQIFSVRKTTTQFYNISENVQEEQQKTIFLIYFGSLKVNCRSFSRLLTFTVSYSL